jgi:KipI family sensor histidine kinase inhibitor
MANDPGWPHFVPAGDAAVLVKFGEGIDPAINRLVHALARRLESVPLTGMGEAVPAYASLLVHYDPAVLNEADLLGHLEVQAGGLEVEMMAPSRLVEIPTLYGGEYGPDLDDLASLHGLATDEVVRIHSAADYLVYMMGFSPGFAYLGGLDPAIATPRLPTPRARVPGGSVGIAGSQTGVYPAASPGGWRLIGWTPLKLFNPDREPPALLAAGDRVRFVPILPDNGADILTDQRAEDVR